MFSPNFHSIIKAHIYSISIESFVFPFNEVYKIDAIYRVGF